MLSQNTTYKIIPMNKLIKLNNGMLLPTVGLGTYKSKSGDCEIAVKHAIDVGYRHFDCAWFYQNEKDVGNALKSKIQDGVVKREDLFITSKLWNNFHSKEDVTKMINVSLRSLQLDYLDLYLIHWPFGFKKESNPYPVNEGKAAFSDVDYLETWSGMEKCIKKEYTKSIGVSNFNSIQIERLVKSAKIKPVCNQVEISPNINQKELTKFCKNYDIVMVGFSPLGRIGSADKTDFPKPTILDPKVIEMSKKYNKSTAQVVLNYLLSLGVAIIPKSVTPSRIKENFEVFDFTLKKEDVEYLDSCNKNRRVSSMEAFKNHPHYPFNIPF